jgi:methyltransferase (TIGR00027 family)
VRTDPGTRTALITAFVRAYHAKHVTPPVFDDALAWQWFTPEERAFLGTSLAKLLPLYDPEPSTPGEDIDEDFGEATALRRVISLIGPTTLCRSRFTENHLERVIDSVAQYVILGAGLDTFAFRRPDLASRLRVFELDQAVTQDLKLRRLADLGWDQPTGLCHLPVDFTRQTVDEVLLAAAERHGYDPAAPTVFSWLGVTYYLPRDVVLATLRSIGQVSAPGSSVVFDYYHLDAFDPARASPAMRRTRDIVRQTGEPMLTGFDPDRLAHDLATTGFAVRENLDSTDLQARFFADRTDGYAAPDHVHLALLERQPHRALT